jgi:periplasmic protein TonB
MIAASPHRFGGQKEAHLQGWLISILLHGTVALIAILCVKQVQITPRDEAFKWNVAMVSPTQQVQSTAPAQNQAPARSVPSTASTLSPPKQQRARTQPLSSPQLLEQPTAQPISERTAPPVVTEPPAPTLTELMTPARSTAHTTEPAEPIRHETGAPMVAESTGIVKPVDASTAVSAESDAQAVPSNTLAAILGQATQSDPASPPTQVAAFSPAPPNAPTKRDFGWLSEAIFRRVEELKRYPASARVDRAEGKVVVRAVINEDGNLGEVEVFQSSGYPTLDKAAVETMRQAAPFHLPHPLGQPRMTIKIPMSYRLDR